MKKWFVFILSIMLGTASIAGGRPFHDRLHPGLEWGYSITVASYHHFNYLDESIGFRINDEGWEPESVSNAFVLGSVTVDFSDFVSLSLISGYEGLNRRVRAIPVSARLNYALRGFDTDGFSLYAGGGMLFISDKTKRRGKQLELGAVYNIVLAPHASVGFKLGARAVTDRPDVWDPISEEFISERNIKRKDASYYALNLGIMLSF